MCLKVKGGWPRRHLPWFMKLGLNSRRTVILAVNAGFLLLLGVTATFLWQRSAAADTALLIPADSVAYQNQLTGFTFSQDASSYYLGGTVAGNVYLMSTNTKVLSGSTVSVDIPTLNQHYASTEANAGQYQFQIKDNVVITPQIAGQTTATLANWQLGLRSMNISLGNEPQASVAQSQVVVKVGDLTTQGTNVAANAGLFPVLTGYVSNANIAANAGSSTATKYTLPVSFSLSAQVLDGSGNPVANQTLAIGVNFPNDAHTETVTIQTDSYGVFTYSRTETAQITVQGGQMQTLSSPMTVQGTSHAQLDLLCTWVPSTCNNNVGPSQQQTAQSQGQPSQTDMIAGQDPVNVVSGNYYDIETDLAYPSVGMGVSVQRTYNSTSVANGQTSTGDGNTNSNSAFGWGWTASYAIAVSPNVDDTLNYVDGYGSVRVYTPNGDGTFAPPPGIHDKLSLNGDGTFTMRLKHGTVQQFDSSGKLVSITDPNGNAMTFAYGGSQGNQLQSFTDTAGRKTTFTWDANNHITSMTDPLGRVFSYSYDANSNLTQVKYPDGSIIGYAYDGSHELTQITDPAGHHRNFTYDGSGHATSFQYDGGLNKITFSYDTDNNKTTTTDSRGNQTVYYYQHSGNTAEITKIVDPLGNDRTYAYDSDGNRTSATDGTGNTTTMTYDSMGNMLTSTDPLGAVTTYTYDATFNNPTSVKDALGNTTTLSYDAQGNLTSATDAQGHVTTIGRDAKGEATSTTDPLGGVTQLTYDTSGNATAITDAANHKMTLAYDGLGHATSMTDALGHKTQISYDGFFRTTGMTRADGSKMGISYDAVGNAVTVTDFNGNKTQLYYDAANQVIQESDAANNVVKIGRDSEENVTSQTDQLGNVTTMTYDPDNRVVKVLRPDNSVVKFAYDANGNRKSMTDGRGNTNTYGYDGNNRLVSVGVPGITGVVQYQYDPLGQLLAVIDLRGDKRTYTYDTLRRLAQFTDANNHTWKYTYDANGNLATRTDAKGQVTTNTYDSLNQLVKSTFADGTSSSYSYDAGGNLTQVGDAHGTTKYAYDVLNRLAQTTEPNGWIEKYGYDANGNRTSLTDPFGNVSTFAYNSLNQLINVTAPNGEATTYTYDAKGELTGQSSTDSDTTFGFDWDKLGRIASETANTVSTPCPSCPTTYFSDTLSYAYDPAGNVASVTDASDGSIGSMTTYAYDALNRLTGVTNLDGSTATYAYDNAGNRTSATVSGTTTTATFDAADQLTKNGTTTFTYDANGNLASAVAPGGTTNYTWDAQDRLAKAQTPTATVSYGYDAFGRMSSRTDAKGTSNYVYDGGNPLLVQPQGAGTQAREFLPGVFGQVLGTVQVNGHNTTQQSQTYYQRDGRGNIIGAAGYGPAVATPTGYDAWGKPQGLSDSDDTYGLPLAYLGLPYDTTAGGLTWAHARWYDASQGRMVSRDPLGGGMRAPMSQNRYAYAMDNPTTYGDPSGMSTVINGQTTDSSHTLSGYLIANGTGAQNALSPLWGLTAIGGALTLLSGFWAVVGWLAIIFAVFATALGAAGAAAATLGQSMQGQPGPTWLAMVALVLLALLLIVVMSVLAFLLLYVLAGGGALVIGTLVPVLLLAFLFLFIFTVILLTSVAECLGDAQCRSSATT